MGFLCGSCLKCCVVAMLAAVVGRGGGQKQETGTVNKGERHSIKWDGKTSSSESFFYVYILIYIYHNYKPTQRWSLCYSYNADVTEH